MTREPKSKVEKGESETPPTLPAVTEPTETWKTNPLLLTARFPHELQDPHALVQFQMVAMAINLNPLLGEVVPIHGRPYITEEGWLRMIDERAAGQLVVDRTELATKEERTAFGATGDGWMGKATVVRRINAFGGYADREVVDWYWFSKEAWENSIIDAVRQEPWRQAMKGAHVRALRRAFRDVLAAVVGDTSLQEPDYIDVNVSEAIAQLPGRDDEDPMAIERRRFWARATELGIRNGSQELADLLGLSEARPGAMKEEYLDAAGKTWIDANVELDKYEAAAAAPAPTKSETVVIPADVQQAEDKPVQQCSECGGLTNDPMYTEDGKVLVCGPKCGNTYREKHPVTEETIPQREEVKPRAPRRRTGRPAKQ